ncbi:hypothetical protein F4703DRAFT_1975680 [Phycomyces blakesleeanus]
MSQVSRIEDLLHELNECRKKTLLKSSKVPRISRTSDPASLATGITVLAMSEVPDNELDTLPPVLFHPEYGILCIIGIGGNEQKQDFLKAQLTLLDFLAYFIPKAGLSLQPYWDSIKKCCLKLSFTKSARLRNAAINVISALINAKKNGLDITVLVCKDLYEHFAKEFTLSASHVPLSTKGKVIILLGSIGKFYPDALDERKAHTYLGWCIDDLDKELFKNEISNNQYIADILEGLTAFISSPLYPSVSDSLDSEKLYKAVLALLNMPEDLTRYAAPRAVLELIANHMNIFGKYLVKDSKLIYMYLATLGNSKNKDIAKSAHLAMESFLEQVAASLSKSATKSEEGQEILKFLLEKLFNTIDAKQTETWFTGLSMIIRSIGYFAKACTIYTSPKEVKELYETLIEKSGWFYSDENRYKARLIRYIPPFVQTLCQFCHAMDVIPDSIMVTITKLMNLYIVNYTRQYHAYRASGKEATQDLLWMLYEKGEGTLKRFAEKFFYNAMMCTSSNKYTLQEYNAAYLIFYGFWRAILNQEGREDKFSRVDKASRKHFADILYDEFLNTFLRIVKTFNLEVKKIENGDENIQEAEEEGQIITPTLNSLVPVNEEDFVLFQNLVDFWCYLIPYLNNERMASCIYIVETNLIELSGKHPLVSGIYKMIATVLSTSEKLGIFNGYKEVYMKEQQERSDIVFMSTETQTYTYSAFVDLRRYLKEVWHRLQQYKDELLASCLRLVLACPREFFEISELVPPMQTALRLGLSYSPLATTAMDAFEKLFESGTEISEDLIHVSALLPLMNEYLMLDLRANSKINFKGRRYRHIRPATIKAQQKSQDRMLPEFHKPWAEFEVLQETQLRMMRSLGRLGGLNKLMLTPQGPEDSIQRGHKSHSGLNDQEAVRDTSISQLLAWDSNRNLKLCIPFPNANIELTLDELLPRICELAELSPDRQTKVAACELLHGIVLVMVGRNAFEKRSRHQKEESQYHKIYTQIFPVILRLAIDSDQISRAMFRSLTPQLIHWLTDNSQSESPETITLLQVCIDATCSTNAGLCDYGADCLYEFAKSSSQRSGKHSKEVPMNIKSLLNRLHALASHPSASKRLAAALIFNRIYPLFQEEYDLVNEYTLELFGRFMLSLRLAEDDHPSIGTQEQTKTAINNIKETLRKHISMFLNESPVRRPFVTLEKTDLAYAVEWSFRESAQPQKEYSNACMEFFDQFVTLASNVSAKEWLEKQQSKTNAFVTDIYETSRLKNSSNSKSMRVSSYILWIRQLNCAMNGYTWLIEREILDSKKLFQDETSVLLSTLIFFVENPPHRVIENWKTENSSNRSKVKALYAYGVFRLCAFLHSIVYVGGHESISILEKSGLLLSSGMARMIAEMLLLPKRIIEPLHTEQGGLLAHVNYKIIQNMLKSLLYQMKGKASIEFTHSFAAAIASVLQLSGVDLNDLELDQASLSDIQQKVEGIKILQLSGLLDIVCKELHKRGANVDSAADYCCQLLDKFIELCSTDEPTWIDILGNILKIAFNQKGLATSQGSALLGLTGVLSQKTHTEKLTIYQKYSDYINYCISSNIIEFAPIIIAQIKDEFTCDVVLGLFDYLKTCQSEYWNIMKTFLQNLTTGTTFLKDLFYAWKNTAHLKDLVTIFKRIFEAYPKIMSTVKDTPIFDIFCDALYSFLDIDQPLSLNSEAFDILPMYLCLESPKINKQIEENVAEILKLRAVSSNDISMKTQAFCEYMDALYKLLDDISVHQTRSLFKIVIPIIIQDNYIQSKIMKLKVDSATHEMALQDFDDATQFCFSYFKDPKLEDNARKNALDITISMLSVVPEDQILSFYKKNIIYIMENIIKEDPQNEEEQNATHTNCSVDNVYGATSEVAIEWEKYRNKSAGGKLMSIDLVRAANRVKLQKHEDCAENDLAANKHLFYRQTAYNTIAAAVMRTQTAESFYVGFLFQDKPNEPLWTSIIPINQKLSLTAQLRQYFKSRQLKGFDDSPDITYSISSLSKSSLSTASFSEMFGIVQNFKHGYSGLDNYIETDLNNEDTQNPEIGDVSTRPLEIEMDQFNLNPCMEYLVELIWILHTKITPPSKDNNDMPAWMANMHTDFNARGNVPISPERTPIAIKLTFAKIIMNCPEAFENYATHWIRPLIKLVTEGEEYGEPMNYFVRDICTVIVFWREKAKLTDSVEDRYILFAFLRYLMQHVFHEDLYIRNENIRIVKEVFDCWHSKMIIPTREIYNQISNPEISSPIIQTGLILAQIVLSHGINPFYSGPEVDLEGLTKIAFFSKLVDIISNTYVCNYGDAAEVSGLALKYLKEKEPPIASFIREKLVEQLQISQKSYDKLVVCLHRIIPHDKDVCSPFIEKVVWILPLITGPRYPLALEILATCSDMAHNVFQSLQSNGLLERLQFKTYAVQIKTLQLLNEIAENLIGEEVKYAVDRLTPVILENVNIDCRTTYYSFLKRVYSTTELTIVLKAHCRAHLIRGLMDSDKSIQEDIVSFLQNQHNMTADIYKRLQIVLRYLLFFILKDIIYNYNNASKESDDYSKPVFDKPLPDARFNDKYQKINTSWQKNLSMVPLFVKVQDLPEVDISKIASDVKETQRVLAYGPIESDEIPTYSTFTQSFNLPENNPDDIILNENYGEDFHTTELLSTPMKRRELMYNQLHRILPESATSKSPVFLRHKQEKLHIRLERYQAFQKKARERKLTMYRNYRIGELPDIQIKYMELIDPLQALARKDNEIARLLHTNLVVSISNYADNNKSITGYVSEIMSTVRENLEKSTMFFSPTVGSFLRVSFELDANCIDSSLINLVSEKSFNQHIGIALVEKQVEIEEVSEREKQRDKVLRCLHIETKKPRTGYENKLRDTKLKWINLATMYKSIDEPEFFQSIYKINVATEKLPKEAIDFEVRGDYETAIKKYTESFNKLKQNTDTREVSVWAQEQLKCHENLTQWEEIGKSVKSVLKDGDYNSLWDSDIQDPYLRYFVRTFTKIRKGIHDEDGQLVPWTSNNPNPLFEFISSAIRSPKKSNYLIHSHPCDISLASIYKRDYHKARQYITNAYTTLLSLWTSLHPLAHVTRLSKLAVLHRTVELEDFLNVMADNQKSNGDFESLQKYINSLSARYPDHILDPMDAWDDIIEARLVFIDHLENLTDSSEDGYDIRPYFFKGRKQFLKEMTSAAKQQNNFSVAINRFQRLENLGMSPLEKVHSSMQITLQLASFSNDITTRMELITNALGKIMRRQELEGSSQEHYAEYLITTAKAFEMARIELQTVPSVYSEILKSTQVSNILDKRNFKDAKMVANHFTKSGYAALRDAYSVSIEGSSMQSECYWNLGEYCDNALRSNLNGTTKILAIQYSKVVIDSYFKAMDRGNKHAIERLPRLLEIIELSPVTGEDFKLAAESFGATWVYIRWIPQLVALLGSSLAEYVFPALVKMSKSYPNALYYPFQISREQFGIKDKLVSESQERILAIKDIIYSPLIEEFTTELRRLTNPEHITKDFIDFVRAISKGEDINPDIIESEFKQFDELVLNPSNKRMGKISKAFAVKHASQLREFMGSNGKKIAKMSEKEAEKMRVYFNNYITNEKLPGSPNLLQSYSPWLSDFQSTNYEEDIEIPGQYTGLGIPHPEHHAKVASFEENIMVLQSLRKPKKICIYGSDEKEYNFLVKGGEDLRLDQRIQQLFTVMNEMIRKNTFCARQDISVTTYKVIPMASSIGMIEWLDNTKTLKSCIEEQLGDKKALTKAYNEYRSYVASFKGNLMGYLNLFKAPRSDVVGRFQRIQALFEKDILKKYLFKMAASPEAFLFIRKDFAHSFSAICIVGYLLVRVSLVLKICSGRLICIDFGYAFGAASELLPVPEIIPFRLTNQLVGVLQPLGVSGVLEVAMTNILQAIQKDTQILLNTMNVFIKEPLLDWKRAAKKQAVSQKNTSKATDSASLPLSNKDTSEWYPQQKLENARRKLTGENPTTIVLSELAMGHKDKYYYSGLETVVRGSPLLNMRAKTGTVCQNTKEQVQCLLDLATDPNILGRMWVGWASYL